MKHFLLSTIFIFLMPLLVIAQEKENYKWQANLFGGLYLENEQAWIIEPSITWHIHKYFGMSVGIEFTSQYNQPSHTAIINGREAYTDDNTNNIGWVIFKPFLVLKTPIVWQNKDRDYQLWFQAEPGFSFACPFRNSATYIISSIPGGIRTDRVYESYPNKGLQWFYWNARLSANFTIDRVVIGVGYGLSNLDYYSCRRNITLWNGTKYHVPKKELSQSIFLSAGYKF